MRDILPALAVKSAPSALGRLALVDWQPLDGSPSKALSCFTARTWQLVAEPSRYSFQWFLIMPSLTTDQLRSEIERRDFETNRLRRMYFDRADNTSLEFARSGLYPVKGHALRFTEFHHAYLSYCRRHAAPPLSIIQATRELRLAGYVIGRGFGNQNYICNVALQKMPPVGPPLRLTERGRLAA